MPWSSPTRSRRVGFLFEGQRWLKIKKAEPVKIWMSERLFVDLNRLAIADDRKLSEYIGVILSRHVYGHSTRRTEIVDGANSTETGRN